MNAFQRQLAFGLIFVGVGIYQLVRKDYWEFSLYAVAGLAFVFNALTLNPKLSAIKKPLIVVTWVLIVTAALLFLYLLQFKF